MDTTLDNYVYEWTIRMLPNPFEGEGNTALACLARKLSTDTRRLVFHAPDDILIECRCDSTTELVREEIGDMVGSVVDALRQGHGKSIIVSGPVAFMNPNSSQAVYDLPHYLQHYLEQAVSVVGPRCPELSSELIAEISRRSTGMSRGLACCNLDDNGAIRIVVIDPAPTATIISHEAIHAAQVHASHEAMEQALMNAAELGQTIICRVLDIVGHYPDANGQYRDIGWMSCAIRNSPEMHTFQMAKMLYPRDETMQIADEYGMYDRQSVAASLFAAYLLEYGFDDWTGDLAREIVAYRYQSENCAAIENLFLSATAQLGMRQNSARLTP